MFLKKFRVKSQSAMKGSDRKKLRADIEQQYKSLSSAQVADLIPNKGDMTLFKIATHSDEVITVYCFEKNPLFFESFKKLFPTVYTLWKYPDILPVFTTYPPVFSKLLVGADLMLPGVIVKGERGPRMFGKLQKGDLCVICLEGNKAPVALGEALLSGEDMYMSAMKGKGVRPMHLYRDELWALGGKAAPPLIPDGSTPGKGSDSEDDDDDDEEETEEQTQEKADNGVEEETPCLEELRLDGAAAEERNNRLEDGAGAEGACGGGGDDEAKAGDDEDEDKDGETDGTAEMDDLLLFCFKCAIKGRITKSDLPLLTAHVLGHMQPFSAKRLDLKKSSYKKFSKFLKQMESEGFIKMKQKSKGVDAIAEVDKSHPDLRGLEIPEVVTMEAEQVDSSDDKFEPPQITDVLCVTADTLPLLQPLGYTKNSLMTTAELRQIVTDYVRGNNLQQDEKKGVLLDPILAHIALTRSEGDRSHLDWATLFGRITNKLTAAVVIHFPGKESVVKKGKIDPIRMDVEQRSSKKKVTIVQNLDAYGVDLQQFAHLIRCKVAGSASVVASEQKGRGPDVVVQGSHADVIYKFLLETYRLPRRFVQPVTKADTKKGKR